MGLPILPQAKALVFSSEREDSINFVVVDFPFVPVTPMIVLFFLKI